MPFPGRSLVARFARGARNRLLPRKRRRISSPQRCRHPEHLEPRQLLAAQGFATTDPIVALPAGEPLYQVGMPSTVYHTGVPGERPLSTSLSVFTSGETAAAYQQFASESLGAALSVYGVSNPQALSLLNLGNPESLQLLGTRLTVTLDEAVAHRAELDTTNTFIIDAADYAVMFATQQLAFYSSATGWNAETTAASGMSASATTTAPGVASQLAWIATSLIDGVDGVAVPLTSASGSLVAVSGFGQFDVNGISRPELFPITTLNVDALGPSPVVINVESVIDQSLGLDDNQVLYVVESAANGVVEKLTASGWVDVSTLPDTGSPAALLAYLQRRTFTAADALRWRSTSAGGLGNTFDVLGWFDNASVGTSQVSMVAAAEPASDAAAVAQALNQAIQGSGPDVRGSGQTNRTQAYTAAPGYGAIIRNFDDGQPDGVQSFLASTLIHNDINVPNAAYPYGDVDAAGNWQGTNINANLAANSVLGQWTTPTLVGVYNLSPNAATRIDPWAFAAEQAGLSRPAASMANAKDPTWGWGVFYGHDANAEKRAYPVFQTWIDGGQGYPVPVDSSYLYDAPFGKSPDNPVPVPPSPGAAVTFARDENLLGATDKRVGNPVAYFDTSTVSSDWQGGPAFGAGAGIHVDLSYDDLQANPHDQNVWSWQGAMNTLAYGQQSYYDLWEHDWGGWWGQVNSDLKGGDEAWTQLMTQLSHGKEFWIEPNVQWIPDLLLPWTNNIKDMINITTALYQARGEVNGWTPPDNVYWGWNEVPIPVEYQTGQRPDGATWWSGFAFVLPEYAAPGGSDSTTHLQTMTAYQQTLASTPAIYNNIARQLDWYHDNGFIGNGSYMLTLRQVPATQIAGGQSASNFVKLFATETWTFSSSMSGRTYTVSNGVLTIT